MADITQILSINSGFSSIKFALFSAQGLRSRSVTVRKYGFHGLSYEYIVSRLPDQGKVPTIIAHLGNGASMAAVVDGRCLDTTMGLTPTGGLVMGTRSGDLDPGIFLYLMAEKGYTAPQLEHLLNHLSGLLGISACSGDMQVLLRQREKNHHAAEAIAQFAYSARKHIGSLMAVLSSVQRLIFTGGIGEHTAALRWAICRPLEALGFRLDPEANAALTVKKLGAAVSTWRPCL